MAISTVLFGAQEWSFSNNLFIELPLISFNSKTLERKTREAVQPEMNKEIHPQTGPITQRFEVTRRGRNNPVCKTPKQSGKVIPASALDRAAPATCT